MVAHVDDTIRWIDLRAQTLISIDVPYYPPYIIDTTDRLVHGFQTRGWVSRND